MTVRKPNTHRRATKFLLTTILSCGIAVPALAQTPPSNPANPPNPYNMIDANGVNLATGEFNFAFGQVATGGAAGEALGFAMQWYGSERRDLTLGWMQRITDGSGTTYYVSFGARTETFTEASGVFTAQEGTGSTLTLSSGIYTYTTSDGTAYEFDTSLNADYPEEDIIARVTEITEPNGIVTTFHYKTDQDVIDYEGQVVLVRGDRVQSITNNLGYQLHIDYLAENITSVASLYNFNLVTGVIAINNAEEYCDPTADNCTGLTEDWPEVTFAYTGTATAPTSVTATDNLSREITVTLDTALRITGITRPQSGDEPISITYGVDGRVATYDDGDGVWNYSYALPGGTVFEVTIDPPVGGDVIVEFDPPESLRPTSVTNGVGDETTYDYDSFGRLTEMTMPEGNSVEYAYDGNGNITSVTRNPKSGSGTIETSATYPCTSSVTCNRPSTTTDAEGNVTNYSWSSTHGGLLSVTLPDPDGAGSLPRPETRYSYAQQYARYRNSSGTIVNAPSQVWRLTRTESCSTGAPASCDGDPEEFEMLYDYGAGGSAATNLLPEEITERAGDGSLERDTRFTYDPFGNVLTEAFEYDTGAFRTTTYRYNAGIQLEGVIAPDPDGAGAQEHLAQRLIYDDNGNVTRADFGTMTSASAAWSTLDIAQSLVSGYDDIGRLSWREIREDDTGGATRFARTDITYDAGSRVTCTAQRMNPAEFSSPPASACTLDTTGSFGPDRIARNHYDNASRLLRTEIGYGTADVADAFVRTYSDNGRLATLADGEGNLTTYEYDGYDRLNRMRYPNASGSGSSTTDDELYAYDDNGNLTARTLRDGAVINFTYDNLNRRTLMNLPGSDPDVTYAYDNFGRLTSATQPTRSLSFTYDILGRQLTETGPLGTVTRQYRLDGARERITFPDSSYFQFSYTATGQRRFLHRNATSGAGNVVTRIFYDALNRPSSWYGENDAVGSSTRVRQTFEYDTALRLDGLVNNVAGTADDLTIGMSFNPASQIAGRTRSNADYIYDAPATGATDYTANGLNQYSDIDPPGSGSLTPAYDARGNITGYDGNTYGYDSLNRLTSATVNGGTITFSYDPLGRLYGDNRPGTANDRFYLYEDAAMIGYVLASTPSSLARRFVHDQGSLGAPVAVYEGSGVALADQSYVLTDERGSVIGLAAGVTGAVQATDAYGPYGEGGDPANTSTYGYTGQLWHDRANLYSMRNRWYLPELGRFMQTDPIGYQGGMNLYGYVGNDPVNYTDPWGLFEWFDPAQIVVTGARWPGITQAEIAAQDFELSRFFNNLVGGNTGTDGAEIVVTAEQLPPCLIPGDLLDTPLDATLAGGDYTYARARAEGGRSLRAEHSWRAFPVGDRYSFAYGMAGPSSGASVGIPYYDGDVGVGHLGSHPGGNLSTVDRNNIRSFSQRDVYRNTPEFLYAIGDRPAGEEGGNLSVYSGPRVRRIDGAGRAVIICTIPESE